VEISSNRSPTARDILGAWIVCALIAGSALALTGGLHPVAVPPPDAAAVSSPGSLRHRASAEFIPDRSAQIRQLATMSGKGRGGAQCRRFVLTPGVFHVLERNKTT